MRGRREKDGQWRLDLNEIEAHLLAGSLDRLVSHYRMTLEDLPEALQDYWRGRLAAEKDAEQLRDAQQQLEEERLAWRGERLPKVEKWLAAYDESGIGRAWTLRLDREEMETFLVVLNDRRLTLAVEFGIDETLMEADMDAINDVALRQALWEVNILAHFQEYCLMALENWETGDEKEEGHDAEQD